MEKWNSEDLITNNASLITADMENMYGNMPLEKSKQGIKEYFESLPPNPEDKG